MENRHTSPFEMCEIKLHLKMPIFVARQWIRHRTANLNEYSGRYSIMRDERYVPDEKVIQGQCTVNKQGRDGTVEDPRLARDKILLHGMDSYSVYQDLVSPEGHGMARELARMTLPLNTYTELYWKIDLHNLLHFLNLRNDSHAQMEIRVFAEEIWKIVQQWVPTVAESFEEHYINGAKFSASQLAAIRAMINGVAPAASVKGMKARQIAYLMGKLSEPANVEQEP